MSDIFEIKSAKIELRIGDRVFEIKDPKFMQRVQIKKLWDGLSKQKDSMDESDYLMAAYDLNKQTIQMFIPTIDDDFIDETLTSSMMEMLLAKITELAENKFGAKIEKSEKK